MPKRFWVAANEAEVQMTDKLTERDITFSKIAAGQETELKDAELTVSGTDISGNAFTEFWKSDGNAKVLKLKAGEYKMVENQAPLGYDIAESIEFKVTTDGKIEIKENGVWVPQNETKVQMTDKLKPNKITFSKVAAGQGTELAGAKLTVKRADDTVVKTWDSKREFL